MLRLDQGIAYLGNSVTAQKDSYTHQLHLKLEKYSSASLPKINAGLGGVGSLACAALLDFLVLRHKPSICFVETSLSDSAGATPIDLVSETLIEIIGRLSVAGITPIFVHLPRTDIPQREKDAVLAIYRECAEKFEVLEVDITQSFPVSNGLRDGIHHTTSGANFTAEQIYESLLKSDVNSQPVANKTLTRVILPEELPRMHFRFTLPYYRLQVSDSVTLPSPGGVPLGLLVIATKSSGVIRITDGIRIQTQQVWDHWCVKPRIQLLHLQPEFRSSFSLTVSMTNLDTALTDCWLRSDSSGFSIPNHQGYELDLVGVVSRSTNQASVGQQWWAAVVGKTVRASNQ